MGSIFSLLRLIKLPVLKNGKIWGWGERMFLGIMSSMLLSFFVVVVFLLLAHNSKIILSVGQLVGRSVSRSIGWLVGRSVQKKCQYRIFFSDLP